MAGNPFIAPYDPLLEHHCQSSLQPVALPAKVVTMASQLLLFQYHLYEFSFPTTKSNCHSVFCADCCGMISCDGCSSLFCPIHAHTCTTCHTVHCRKCAWKGLVVCIYCDDNWFCRECMTFIECRECEEEMCSFCVSQPCGSCGLRRCRNCVRDSTCATCGFMICQSHWGCGDNNVCGKCLKPACDTCLNFKVCNECNGRLCNDCAENSEVDWSCSICGYFDCGDHGGGRLVWTCEFCSATVCDKCDGAGGPCHACNKCRRTKCRGLYHPNCDSRGGCGCSGVHCERCNGRYYSTCRDSMKHPRDDDTGTVSNPLAAQEFVCEVCDLAESLHAL